MYRPGIVWEKAPLQNVSKIKRAEITPYLVEGILVGREVVPLSFREQIMPNYRTLAILVLVASLTTARGPDISYVRLDTSQGVILIELHRDWAPIGVDRFSELVRTGYYDGNRFFRVIADRWAQIGINGDPKVSEAWRTKAIRDDPRVETNARGTVAFAFAVPNGRTTQVFINLRDNSATHDKEPFVPIGRVVEGMDVADRLYAGYGETSGSGIRAGKQGPLFAGGNPWLDKNFPKLDWIRTATIDP